MLKKVKMLFISFLLILGILLLDNLMIDTVASANTQVNVQSEGMRPANKSNNKIMQQIINQHTKGVTTLYFPKGTYSFTAGAVILHSNLILNFASGASFNIDNGHFFAFAYPSPRKGYNGGINNVQWNNATFTGSSRNGQSSFTQSMNHAQNISFNNCTFYNCENPYGHNLDIDGSRNITVQGSSFVGFNGDRNNEYKEAIQIDYADRYAMSYYVKNDQYDDLPTYNVHVSNNRFLPIWDGQKIRTYAPNPIGEHITYQDGRTGVINHIYFIGNEVVDSRPRQTDTVGTINFDGVSDLTIANNRFLNVRATGPSNYIRIYNPLKNYKMGYVYITRNEFLNINPTQQYIYVKSNFPSNVIKKVFISGNIIISGNTNIPFINSGKNQVIQNGNQSLDI
ncbi:N-acetylmuramoyl-L-alanine amidase [Lactiplantibacillus paraxiangfangensis]|uniref:N-acetylmuramoyl-L-alanine amidase n=1 Tax=Lactiplantibacillus paraxiangfangensis TaxID=3076224 RepID=UPI0030C68D69